MLGIVIGVGSVIVMIGIGTGSKQAALTVIQKMGSNTLIIFNGGAVANSRMGPMAVGAIEVFKEEDAALIEEELSHSSVLAATPQVRTSSSVVFQNINYLTTVQGARVAFPKIQGWNLQDGRTFTQAEVKGQAKVCLAGATVVKNLFPGGEDPVGQMIRIGKLPCELIGVLAPKGAGMMGDQDDVIIAPYTTVMHKIMGRDHIQNLLVSAQEGRAQMAESEIAPLRASAFRLGGGAFLALAGLVTAVFVLPDASQKRQQTEKALKDASRNFDRQVQDLKSTQAEVDRIRADRKAIEELMQTMPAESVGKLQWRLSQKLWELTKKDEVRLLSVKYGAPAREGTKGSILESVDVEFATVGIYMHLKAFMLDLEGSKLPFAVVSAKLEEVPEGAHLTITLRAFRQTSAPADLHDGEGA